MQDGEWENGRNRKGKGREESGAGLAVPRYRYFIEVAFDIQNNDDTVFTLTINLLAQRTVY